MVVLKGTWYGNASGTDGRIQKMKNALQQAVLLALMMMGCGSSHLPERQCGKT